MQGRATGIVKKALTATAAFDTTAVSLPGPIGESNRLSFHPKGAVLCLGPTVEIAIAQAVQALGAGCEVLVVTPNAKLPCKPLLDAALPLVVLEGSIQPDSLKLLAGIVCVAAAGTDEWMRPLHRAMAQREGPIVPLETQVIAPSRFIIERHLCIDTTAAGGNASLLASSN